jgi:hypothetical protein
MVSVRRSGLVNVAVQAVPAPVVLPPARTASEVEAVMVEGVLASWRIPGIVGLVGAGARRGFAGDAPWELMAQSARAGDYDARGGDAAAPGGADGDGAGDSERSPRAAATQRDLAMMALAEALLFHLSQRARWTKGRTAVVSDGAIVSAVARQRARGGGVGARVDWGVVAAALGLADMGCGDVLRQRHAAAIRWLCRQQVRAGAD